MDTITPTAIYPLLHNVAIQAIQPGTGDEDKPRIILTYEANDDIGNAMKALGKLSMFVASEGNAPAPDPEFDAALDAAFTKGLGDNDIVTQDSGPSAAQKAINDQMLKMINDAQPDKTSGSSS